MKCRKALPEEELRVRDKVSKASQRASKTREQTLHMQARTDMISMNTFHIACAKGSTLQCCSLGFAIQSGKHLLLLCACNFP